ncbi:Uncharacterized protein APZ42_003871 [Daphnia magna]|uniref:Uncharacterized protein n=1 Tax=Daphnia magna TaxID=35525 RepID=A0A164HDY6_9CRUS|nr:Uncharacterized protein APZ42_003871 [Daphnia magna]
MAYIILYRRHSSIKMAFQSCLNCRQIHWILDNGSVVRVLFEIHGYQKLFCHVHFHDLFQTS